MCTYACKLKDFSSQVLKHGSNVDGGLGTNAHFVLCIGLEKTLDTTARELESDKVSRGRMVGW